MSDRMRDAQKEILLVPIGKVLVDILEEIAVALRKTYKFHVRIGRSEEPDTATYLDDRRQFDAHRLLPLVVSRKRESLAAVLGVVDADMFADDKTFIFGMHVTDKGAALLALARLREEFYKKRSQRELFLRRAVTEAIAQVGWAMGLPACTQKQCVLQSASSLWRLDQKGQALCPRSQEFFTQKTADPDRTVAAADAGAAVAEELEAAAPAAVLAAPEGAAARPEPEDESETAAEIMEPEGPVPAEEAAVHTESEGPEEPLVADR